MSWSLSSVSSDHQLRVDNIASLIGVILETDGHNLLLTRPDGEQSKIVLPADCIGVSTDGISASFKKRRGELVVTVTPPEKQIPQSFPPSPPPRTKLNRNLFFSEVQKTFSHKPQFEILIESMQSWRLAKDEGAKMKTISQIARVLVQGCAAAEEAKRIPLLSALFGEFLENSTQRNSFAAKITETMNFEGLSACDEGNSKNTAKDIAAVATDEDATKVLEYVCATGHLPDDSQEESPSDRPLFKLKENFLSNGEYVLLRQTIMHHPDLLESGSENLGDGFSSTKGFIFRFNESGISRLRKSTKGKCLLPFFEAVRDQQTNAFVLNVLCCCPSKSETDEEPPVVGWHKDATLALKHEARAASVPFRLAYSVSVFYLNIPEDIRGGDLNLRNPNNKSGVDAIVSPKNNRLCIFRGDAEHCVNSFSGSGNRVSIVLEQYKVPPGETPFLVEFEEVQQAEYMKIRL